MENLTFAPAYGSGVTVAPGVASAEQVIGAGRKTLMLTNLGSVTCYVRVGFTSVAATVADCPILAGSQVTISKSEDASKVSFVTAAGATSLHIMEGEGF